MRMKLDKSNIEEGINSWVKEDLKRGPTLRYELGRFLFGVSSGSVGILISLERLSSQSLLIDYKLSFALLMLLLSSILALKMAIPVTESITEETELITLYRKQIQSIEDLTKWWFVSWLIGLLISMWSLY